MRRPSGLNVSMAACLALGEGGGKGARPAVSGVRARGQPPSTVTMRQSEGYSREYVRTHILSVTSLLRCQRR